MVYFNLLYKHDYTCVYDEDKFHNSKKITYTVGNLINLIKLQV